MPLWRYEGNPIIGRNPAKGVARIFNSAVVPYEDGFIGVFRGEQINGVPYIYLGRSKDGICQDFYGAAIGMAKTTDFKRFVRLESPFLPFNRKAVLFPRKVNGKFLMLSRPSDSGHMPFGDIFVSESPDMVYWGKHRHVMGKGSEWWLLFYHGVTSTCNGYVYSIGGAILDIERPSVVKYRCEKRKAGSGSWFGAGGGHLPHGGDSKKTGEFNTRYFRKAVLEPATQGF